MKVALESKEAAENRWDLVLEVRGHTYDAESVFSYVNPRSMELVRVEQRGPIYIDVTLKIDTYQVRFKMEKRQKIG